MDSNPHTSYGILWNYWYGDYLACSHKSSWQGSLLISRKISLMSTPARIYILNRRDSQRPARTTAQESELNSKSHGLMLRSSFIAMYKNLWCFGPGRPVGLLHERKTAQQSSFQSLTTFSVSATELWSEKEKNLQRKWQTKSHKKMKASKKIKTKMSERDKRRRDEKWEMKEMKQWFFI